MLQFLASRLYTVKKVQRADRGTRYYKFPSLYMSWKNTAVLLIWCRRVGVHSSTGCRADVCVGEVCSKHFNLFPKSRQISLPPLKMCSLSRINTSVLVCLWDPLCQSASANTKFAAHVLAITSPKMFHVDQQECVLLKSLNNELNVWKTALVFCVSDINHSINIF